MKAILIVDIPDDYEKYGNGVWYIMGEDLNIVYEKEEALEHYLTISGMAQLKPMPNKRPVSYHDDLYGDVEKNYTNIGWNACIEEIEK